MKTVRHPKADFTLTFDPASHVYRDDQHRRYLSCTAFVKRFFAPFDAPSVAAQVSARTGQPASDLIAAWRANADASATFGTLVHAYAESLLRGEPAPAPANDAQRAAFATVDRALAMLSASFDFLEPEQIVFDPLHLLSGTIDIPARHRATGTLNLIDWKTCKAITNDAYGRTALPPIAHIPDSKLAHYRLQLATYEFIMRDSGYIAPDEPLDRALVHIAPSSPDPTWIPLDPAPAELETMIASWFDSRDRHARIAETTPATEPPQPEPDQIATGTGGDGDGGSVLEKAAASATATSTR